MIGLGSAESEVTIGISFTNVTTVSWLVFAARSATAPATADEVHRRRDPHPDAGAKPKWSPDDRRADAPAKPGKPARAPDTGADRPAPRPAPTDKAPRRADGTGKPATGRKPQGAGKPPPRGPKGAERAEGSGRPAPRRPEGSGNAPTRKPRASAAPAPTTAPAPARPERNAALDPSARLDRPGAKPRAGARKGKNAPGGPSGPAKPRGAKGKPPRGRPGPGDGSKPPFRPRRG